MTIYIDVLAPIPIPLQRKPFSVKVYSIESPLQSPVLNASPLASSVYCMVKEVSGDLITGQIIKTPKEKKPYNKGDMLLFTKDKVQDIFMTLDSIYHYCK